MSQKALAEGTGLCAGSPRSHRRLRRNFLPAGLGAVGGLMVTAGAEGPKWGRSPVLDIGRREFITLLGGAAIFVYLLSRTFFPMAVRTYSSLRESRRHRKLAEMYWALALGEEPENVQPSKMIVKTTST